MMLNLVVLRVRDLEVSRQFYESVGIRFTREQHGKGPEHYASDLNGTVFEIYPQGTGEASANLRLGFTVPSVDDVIAFAKVSGIQVQSDSMDSLGNRRAVVVDPDGNRVELRESGIAPAESPLASPR